MESLTKVLLFMFCFLMVTIVLSSCKTDNKSNAIQDASVMSIESKTQSPDKMKEVDISASTIQWKGYKLIGNHAGTIDLKEGVIYFDKDEIAGGTFVIDMNSIKATELSEEDEEEEDEEDEEGGLSDEDELASHLKDGDFFDVKNHPTATYSMVDVSQEDNQIRIAGNMTIKGITRPVSFDCTQNGNKVKATISVDRTEFGIKYGSGSFFSNLGDNIIKDVFILEVKLVLKD